MIRIYILIGLAFLTYYGYDGMRGDDTLKTLSLADLEAGGAGESRYLEISDCFTTGVFVYEYKDDDRDRATSVIFPVISSDAFIAEILKSDESDTTELLTESESSEMVTTHLLVKRSTARFAPECAAGDGSCTQDLIDYITDGEEIRGFTVKGTTRLGLDDLDEKDRDLIQSLNYNIADNVVFLEEDSEPRGTSMSLLMIVGGILGMLITIGTWFAGRSSAENTTP